MQAASPACIYLSRKPMGLPVPEATRLPALQDNHGTRLRPRWIAGQPGLLRPAGIRW